MEPRVAIKPQGWHNGDGGVNLLAWQMAGWFMASACKIAKPQLFVVLDLYQYTTELHPYTNWMADSFCKV